MAFEKFDPNDDDSLERFRNIFGPEQIDQQIRQALHFCWMGLPKDRRSATDVEAEFRRMVERAIRDFKEDRERFGRDDA